MKKSENLSKIFRLAKWSRNISLRQLERLKLIKFLKVVKFDPHLKFEFQNLSEW